jgi:hypothetical protein
MEEIEKRFNDEFSPWGIRLPEEDVTNRWQRRFQERRDRTHTEASRGTSRGAVKELE